MLVFNPSALGDLRRIAIWYRRYRLPPHEALFFDRLRVTLRHVETSPTSFAIVLEDIGLRRARGLRSPQSVHFAVRADHVRIVGIVHGARDPQTWERRAKEDPIEQPDGPGRASQHQLVELLTRMLALVVEVLS